MKLYKVEAAVVAVTDGTISATGTDRLNVTVNPAAASRLIVTGSGSQTAGAAQTVTVTATDPYGNTDTGYIGAKSLTYSGANSSTSPVTAPTVTNSTPAAVNFGTATTNTFTSGVSNTAGGVGSMKLYKVETANIAVTDGTIGASTGADRLTVAVSPAAATRLVVTGSSTQTAGAAQTVTVTAKDAYGNTDTGYSGAKSLTYSGASSSTNPVTAPTVTNSTPAAIGFGSATTNTFTNGVSNTAGGVGSMTLYKAEAATIAVTDGTLSAAGGDRLSVTVNPATASRLVVTGSAAQTAGASQTATVTATDPYGNVDTAYTGNHTLTFTGANSSTNPVTAPTFRDRLAADQNFGSANTSLTFTTGVASGLLKLYKVETANIVANDGTITSAGADRLTVAVSATASRLIVTGTATQTAGTSQTATVTATDPYGNVDLGYTGNHTLTFTGASSSTSPVTAPTFRDRLAADQNFGSANTSLTFTAGVASGLLKLYKVETANIVANDGTLTSTGSDRLTVAVSAAAASRLVVTGSGGQLVGNAQALAITATDPYGNTDLTYTGSHNLTFSGANNSTSPAITPTVTNSSASAINFGSTTAVTFTNGVSSSGGSMTLYKVETANIVANDGSITSAGGDRLTVVVTASAGTATRLVVTGSGSQTAGAAQSLTITATDAYGNTDTGYTGAKNLTFSGANSSSSPATAPTVTNNAAAAINFGSTTAVTFTAGVSTTGGSMKLYKAEAATVAVTDGTISAAGADRLSVAVSPASASRLVVSGSGSQTAGVAQSLTITATDPYGNTDTGYTGAHNLTFSGANSSTNPVTAPTVTNNAAAATNFGSTTAVTFTSGVSTSGGSMKLYKVEAATVAVTDGTISAAGADRLSVTVNPAAASRLVVTGSASQTVGAAQTVTVTATDPYGNTDTGYTGAHSLTYSGANSSASPVTAPTVTNSAPAAIAFGSATTNTFTSGVSNTAGGVGSMKLYKAEVANIAVTDGTIGASTGSDRLSVTVSPGTATRLVVTGSASQTAGAAQTVTVTATDVYGNTDTSYSGAKSLTYSGASSSTNPVTAPTVTNSTPAAVNFGSTTTNTFTNGVSNTAGGVGSMKLYKVEAATIAVTDGTLSATGSDRLSVAVTAAAALAPRRHRRRHADRRERAGADGHRDRPVRQHRHRLHRREEPHLQRRQQLEQPGHRADRHQQRRRRDQLRIDHRGHLHQRRLNHRRLDEALQGRDRQRRRHRRHDRRLHRHRPPHRRRHLQQRHTPRRHRQRDPDGRHVADRDRDGDRRVRQHRHRLQRQPHAHLHRRLELDQPGHRADLPRPPRRRPELRHRQHVARLHLRLRLRPAQALQDRDGEHRRQRRHDHERRQRPSQRRRHRRRCLTPRRHRRRHADRRERAVADDHRDRPVRQHRHRLHRREEPHLQRRQQLDKPGHRADRHQQRRRRDRLRIDHRGHLHQRRLNHRRLDEALQGRDRQRRRHRRHDRRLHRHRPPHRRRHLQQRHTPRRHRQRDPDGRHAQTATVTATDPYGNTDTAYTGAKNLTFSGANSSTNPATAPTVTNNVAAAVNFGSTTAVTFTSGVSTTGGSMKLYKVEAAVVAVTDGTLSAAGTDRLNVTVNPAAATRLVITGTATQTAGNAQSLTIKATDPYGNTDTGYTGAHNLTFSGANNSTNPATTPTVTNNSAAATNFGTATAITFTAGVSTTGGSMKLYKAEAAIVAATDGSIVAAGADRLSVAVSSAAASRLVVTGTATQTAGAAQSVTITATDPYGNTDTAYTGAKNLTFSGANSSTNPVTAPTVTNNVAAAVNFGSTTAVTFTSGVSTTGGSMKLYKAETANVAVTDGTIAASTGTDRLSVAVSSAAASRLVVTGSATQTAGAAQSLTITATDPYGNTDTGYTGAKNLTFSGANSSTNPVTAPTVTNNAAAAINFGSTTAVTFTSGVSTTGGSMKLYKVEAAVVAVTDGTLSASAGDRLNVTVNPAAASRLVVTGSATQTAGAAQSLTIKATDPYGNTDTSYTGAHNLTFSGANNSTNPATTPTVTNNSAAATNFGSTTAITFTSGVSTSGGSMKLYKAEGAVVAVTDGTISAAGADRLSVAVSAATASRLVVTGTATQTAGTSQVATITATDPYGNTDTAYTGNHTLTFTGANSSTNPATAPTFRDRLAADQNFGSANTSLTFTSGVASGLLKLYKTETANIVANDGTITSAGGDRLTITVSAAAASRLVVTGTATQTAGTSQTATVTATDPYGNVDLGYTGNHTLTFTGASSSTNPVTAPTFRDRLAADQNFGTANTSLTFTSGVASGLLKLYKTETANIVANDGTITSAGGDRLTITVSAAAASRLVVTGTATQTAGTSQTATVTATDPYGNVDLGYTGNHTLTFTGASSSTNPATAPTFRDRLAADQNFGTANTSLTFTTGVASGLLKLYKAETATIVANDGTITSAGGDRLTITVGAAAASKLDVTSVPGSNVTAGASFSTTFVSEDAYGNASNVVANTDVTLNPSGSGIVANNTGTITAGTSSKTLSTVQYTKAESLTLVAHRTSGDALSDSAASGSITVVAGTFTKLQLLLPGETAAPGSATGKTGAPSAQTAGSAFNVTVNAVDANWNLVNTITDTAGITSTDANATLPANAALVAGTKTYSVTPKTAGSKTFTATDITNGGITANTSPATTINAGAFAKLQILLPGETAAPGTATGKTGTPSAQTAGGSFNATVNAVDANWNPVSATDSVALSSSDTNATPPAPAALVAGTQTFAVILATAGSSTVTATDQTNGSMSADTSPATTVNPGAFTKLQLLLPGETAAPGSATGKTGTPSAQTAGSAFSVTVNAVDANWNLVNSITDTAGITSTDANATLPANAALVAGTKTYSVTPKTAGSKTFTATDISDGAKTPNTSPATTINVGAFTKLQILMPGETAAPGTATGKTGTPSAQTAGTGLTVTVNAVDANWNVVSSTDTVGITSSDANATLPSNAALVAGTKTFSVTPKTAGSKTFTATDITNGGMTANTSPATTINAAAFSKLQILLPGETAAPGSVSGKTGTPSAQTAGSAFTVTVNAVDADWNPVTSTDTVAITSSDTNATLPANAALVAGTQTFSVTPKTAGSKTFTATDATNGGMTPNTSPATTINAAAFSKLQILLPGETAAPGTATGKTGTPSAQTASGAFTVTVNAVDANWNLVSSVTDTAGITSTDANATLPANAALVAGTKTYSVTPKTAGTATFTASDISDGAKTANTSPSTTINAGAFTKLQILLPGETAAPGTASGKTGTPSAQTAGGAFVVTVNAVDADWNLVSSTHTVALSTSDTNATPPAPAALSAGSQTFALVVPTAGSATVTATDQTDGSKSANTSPSTTINAGAFSKLQILLPGETAAPGTATGKTGTPSARTAGSSFTATVNAVDANWNPVTSTDTIAITSSDANATLPSNAALVAGTQTFSITPKTAGTATFTATDSTNGAKSPNTSPSTTINAGTFTKLQILMPGETAAPGTATGKTGTPSNRTAGSSFSVTVNAVDANWNVVNTITDTAGITSTDANATLPANAALVAGTKTFTVTAKTAGSATFTASDISDGAKTANTSPSTTIDAAAFSKLQILMPGETAAPGTATGKTGTPSARTAGSSFTVTVNSVDANWNPVSSTDTIGITSSDANAALPANAALVAGTQTYSVTAKTAGTATFTSTDITNGGMTANTSPSTTINAGRVLEAPDPDARRDRRPRHRHRQDRHADRADRR